MTAPVPDETGPDDPPVTGNPDIDAATGRLGALDDRPLAEHPEQLSHAHEALHAALQDRPTEDA